MKNFLKQFMSLLFPFLPLGLDAQKIAGFTLKSSSDHPYPVHLNLDLLTSEQDSSLILYQIVNGQKIKRYFQVDHTDHRVLWWMVEPGNGSSDQVYELRKEIDTAKNNYLLSYSKQDGGIILKHKNTKVLKYNIETVYPPSGQDSAYKRSGFIHPLWSLNGDPLTRIQPPDHYHHYGIWNPWTKVRFRNREVDFWNLNSKQGTVEFADILSLESGNVYAGFHSLMNHVVFGEINETALKEQWTVKVFAAGENFRLIDLTSTLSCAGDEPVHLLEYRYGGFGFRATEAWNNKNSFMLTSEGHNRKTADGTLARWCMIDGDIGKNHPGILFMSHPANYNHPEPIRVWPEDMYGRGDVFFNFSPTKNKDWTIIPGKKQLLRYRMMIYEGKLTTEQAEQAWKSFAKPPEIKIQNTNSIK